MRIPIHIVTGFLGSGKTTFIKKLLLNGSDEKTIVLINELGEIGIDNLLVKNITDNAYLLPSGCLCCTVLDSLKNTLLDLLNKQKQGLIPEFNRIIIETTGLANPASILATVQNDTHIKGKFKIHGLTTVVDAENASLQARLHPEWMTQVVAANQILLSKLDRINESSKQLLVEEILRIHEDVQIKTVHEIHNIDCLFTDQTSMQRIEKHSVFFQSTQKNEHSLTQTCVIESDHEIDWVLFGIWLNLLLDKYGEQILRIKGILKLKDYAQPVVIHGVQHCLYTPEHIGEWPWHDEQISKIVVIGRHIDIALVQRSFQLFMHKINI